MKKWISGLVFLFSMQFSLAWSADYKVVEYGDMGVKGLESILKKHAKLGWLLKQVVYRQNHATMMVILEKQG